MNRPFGQLESATKEGGLPYWLSSHYGWGEGLNGGETLRVHDVGRIEGLLLEIVQARSGKRPEGHVWEVLERLTEEVLLLWAERERDGIREKPRASH